MNDKTQNKPVNFEEMKSALTAAIFDHLNESDVDMKCLDWCSYNPDFHINSKTRVVA